MAVKISISFKDNEVEKAMYKFLQSQISASFYIKSLIKREMEKEDIEETKPKKISNFNMDF